MKEFGKKKLQTSVCEDSNISHTLLLVRLQPGIKYKSKHHKEEILSEGVGKEKILYQLWVEIWNFFYTPIICLFGLVQMLYFLNFIEKPHPVKEISKIEVGLVLERKESLELRAKKPPFLNKNGGFTPIASIILAQCGQNSNRNILRLIGELSITTDVGRRNQILAELSEIINRRGPRPPIRRRLFDAEQNSAQNSSEGGGNIPPSEN